MINTGRMSQKKEGNQEKFTELSRKNQEALTGGGEKRIAQQHAKGKLTARERVQLLVDDGSFQELGKFVMHRSKDFGLDKEHYLGDGVVGAKANIGAGHGDTWLSLSENN